MSESKLRVLVGERLRELRGDKSQAEFAELCGLTQPQVSAYEAGGSLPGLEVLTRIAKATDIDLNEFTALARIAEEPELPGEENNNE